MTYVLVLLDTLATLPGSNSLGDVEVRVGARLRFMAPIAGLAVFDNEDTL